MDPEPGAVLGRYEIIREIGRGPMGVVHASRHVDSGETVALKLLRPAVPITDEVRRRIRDELRALVAHGTPHLLAAREFGMHQGRLFVVSPLSTAGSLQRRLDEQGPLARGAAIMLCLRVTDALAIAHDAGVGHGGVKPTNVLRGTSNGRSLTQLADFGAVLRSQDWLVPDAASSYDGYTAPELLAGGSVDERSDLYSVGCLLHAALVGTPPTPGGPSLAREDEIDDAIAALVRRAVREAPAERFSGFAELTAELRGLVVALRPPGAGESAPMPVPEAGPAAAPVEPVGPTSGGVDPAPEHTAPLAVVAESLAARGGSVSADAEKEARPSRARGRRTRVVIVGLAALALLTAAGSWAWGQSHDRGGDPPHQKAVTTLGVPTVAARPAYRSVVFTVAAAAADGVVEVNRGSGWEQAPSGTVKVPTAMGGQRACLRARISNGDEHGDVARACGKSAPPTLRTVRVHPDCLIDGQYTQVCYQLQARGYRPGSDPVLSFEVDGTLAGTVSVPIDRRGTGELPDGQHFHFADTDAGKTAKVSLGGTDFSWTVASR
ncbi:serine/threonine-protein kinase [Nocardioides terrisoli]|uniref:serine/threonine-protein kinase n=1 Tax=Nocardioides terrisoli TaxID=3388267 RepID=UPI00287BA2E4|nr:serine/threonine-protein kinase [Nocardioides marmorisolisilvae]